MDTAANLLIRQWWRQEDQYGWVSSYLLSRRLRTFTRLMVAMIVASFGLVPVTILLSQAGVSHPIGESAAIFVAGCCLTMAVLWALRWPSRGQSAAFALVSTACIAVTCAIDQDRQAGLMGCVTFAMICGYAAVLHTARFMVFPMACGAITTFTLAANLIVDQPDLSMAAIRMALGALTMLAFPLIVQALMFYLIADAHRSDIDPLSGLLNRRGFDRSAAKLLTARPCAGDRYLTLVMIDLDEFKRINDIHGHAGGDRALIAVGEALTQQSRDTAIVARVGGEEFVVVDTYPTATVTAAEKLRTAIACNALGITASIGVATIPLQWRPPGRVSVIDELIDAADAAMYEAKRAGGDQTRQRHLGGLSNA